MLSQINKLILLIILFAFIAGMASNFSMRPVLTMRTTSTEAPPSSEFFIKMVNGSDDILLSNGTDKLRRVE